MAATVTAHAMATPYEWDITPVSSTLFYSGLCCPVIDKMPGAAISYCRALNKMKWSVI
jgi:hypothetical protein